MKVRELTDRLWYVQEVAIYDHKTDVEKIALDNNNNLAIYSGVNGQLSSSTYKTLMEREVVNYGVIDNKFVIEVR